MTLRKILCYIAVTLIYSEGWKSQPQKYPEEEV